jgi:hypothetical protein
MHKCISLFALSLTLAAGVSAAPSDVPFIRPPRIVVQSGQTYTMSGNLGRAANPILIPIARPMGAPLASAVRPGPISSQIPVLENIREPYFYVDVPGEGPGGVTPMPPYPTLPLRSVQLQNGKLEIDLLALAKLVGDSTTVTLKGAYEGHNELGGGPGGYYVMRHYLSVDSVLIRGKAVPADLPLAPGRLQALAIAAVSNAHRAAGSISADLQADLTVRVTVRKQNGATKAYTYDALTGRVSDAR